MPPMQVAFLILAAISILAINVYGWRAIPDDARLTVRWTLHGSTGSLSKREGLSLWLLEECLLLGGSAFAALLGDPTPALVGLGLLTYLLMFHFFRIRRLR